MFKKLNEHSKDLQTKQEEIIKMHNSLAAQYEELKHLKNNMDDYLGRDKTEKKESVIGVVKKHQAEDCLLYTSPSPRDRTRSRMPSSA